MLNQVRRTLRRYDMFAPGDTVTVALSGGADSVSLLVVLMELREELQITLQAAHLNHRLRGAESDRDEAFVRSLCEKLEIPLFVEQADVRQEAAKSREGLEECGRRLRYAFLERIAGTGKIATAHTLSDCAETVLFHLCRGTSLKGLCGIPPVRDRVVRPLIECSREQIEEFCRENGLSYVTDSTNASDEYTRNHLRLNVVPQLKKVNPSFYDALRRMMRSNREDEAFLEESARRALQRVTRSEGLCAAALLQEPRPIRLRILADRAAEECGHACESKHIEKMEELLREGGQTVICGGVTARVRQGILEFIHGYAPVRWSVEVEGDKTPLPMGVLRMQVISPEKYEKLRNVHKNFAKCCLDFDTIQGRLFLRSRLEGDSIRLGERGVTKTLKKLFNEEKIAPEKRLEIAVLADDNGVLWVSGFGADERCAVTESTQKILALKVVPLEGNV